MIGIAIPRKVVARFLTNGGVGTELGPIVHVTMAARPNRTYTVAYAAPRISAQLRAVSGDTSAPKATRLVCAAKLTPEGGGFCPKPTATIPPTRAANAVATYTNASLSGLVLFVQTLYIPRPNIPANARIPAVVMRVWRKLTTPLGIPLCN